MKNLTTLTKTIAILTLPSLILHGCSWGTDPQPDNSKARIPKVPTKKLPGGSTDNWRYLGINKDGTFAVEINDSSITTIAGRSGIRKFQDRKTIVNPVKFNYPTNKKYKYSLSWWKIDCTEQKISITETELYNDLGISIQNDSFSQANAPWKYIEKNSIAQLQYDYVCLNVNRHLGY